MQMEGPSTYQQCQDFDNGVLSSIRHHLKKNNFYNFDSLLDALQSQDKAGPPNPFLSTPPPSPPLLPLLSSAFSFPLCFSLSLSLVD